MTIQETESTANDFCYVPPFRLESLSVVMPAYNEAQNVERAVMDALDAAALVTDDYEVIVVDDGSTDGTAAVVEAVAAVVGNGRVKFVRNERNMGYGPTVRRAWAAATKEWLLFTDSDCQFDLTELTGLVSLTDGADIVTGWRRKRRDPWMRRLNARIFNIAGRACFGTGIRDVDCAFKLMRTRSVQRLDLTATSAMVNTELLYQARVNGLVVREMPVTHHERRFGVASGGDVRVIARAVREFVSMRWRFNQDPDTKLRVHCWVVALLALLAGTASTVWTVRSGHVLAYGDAEAHLNISKRVVSGLTPGLSQLGSVWLPLPHVLMAPFVLPDWLWRTGLAGAAVGIPSLVMLAVYSFRLAHLVTGSLRAALVAPAVVVLNPNTMYLAATPMTEVLLLAMVTASLFYLARWVMVGGTTSLVLCAIFASLATLTRYDGWALVCIEALVVGFVAARRHRTRQAVEGMLVLFAVLAFSGIAWWLIWNQVIFSNPLYFANSVYGSAEQQQFFLENGLLPTYHNAAKSLIYWLEDVRLIGGLTVGVLAGIGLAILIVRAFRQRKLQQLLIVGATMSCFVFYVLSLYLGQASLILPRFVASDSVFQMSNIRYGVQALLPIGLLLACLAAVRPRVLTPVLLTMLVLQGALSISTGTVMAFEDGTQGLSSQKISKGPDSPPVEKWLRANYDGGLVLMDDYRRPVGPVESGVPMDQFIGTGNKPYWQESLDNPGKYASWIVLQQSDTDAVWRQFSAQSRSTLADHFVEVFRSGAIHVYKRRPENLDDFVIKRGQHLYLNEERWNAVGVNSYDLLEQSHEVIATRITALAGSGFNAVRTWCFDKDGGITDETLEKLGTTLDAASAHGIRIICTLSNDLPDFGGKPRFTPQGEDFYTSSAARTAYRAQVARVLEYRTATGVRLAEHPAILAWDLINEPRPGPSSAAESVATWAEEMAGFVGKLDQRHLITIGSEGFQDRYPADPTMAALPGVEFRTLCEVAGITLCTGHLFPKYLAHPNDSQEIEDVFTDWREAADELQKPIVVGEVGYSLADPGHTLNGRLQFSDNVARAVANNDLDGGLLWNVGGQADTTFTLQSGEPESDRVAGSWATLIPRNP